MSISLESICQYIWVVISCDNDGFSGFLCDLFGDRFWGFEESLPYITTYTERGAKIAATYYRNQYGVKKAVAIPLSDLPKFMKGQGTP